MTISMGAEPTAGNQTADADLVKAVAGGDRHAFAALYDRYCRQAYSLARRVCVDPEFAEEAVQDAFLAVWRDPHRFDPARGGFASWLLTLVHHRSVDVVRRQAGHRNRTVPGAEEFFEQLVPAEAGADEKAMSGVVGGLVRQALGQLSADQRQVIGLAYLGGYTQAEVSSITGLPLGTVKSRTFAGIKRLRQLLAALAGSPDNAPWTEVQ
ncbi:MAG TPA: sigma-70 family RNA polymerase sigma factor [Kutzneria sp.]|nr:sigma-70 family RNA polymerase sigma factor [Kutzneria sp.]